MTKTKQKADLRQLLQAAFKACEAIGDTSERAQILARIVHLGITHDSACPAIEPALNGLLGLCKKSRDAQFRAEQLGELASALLFGGQRKRAAGLLREAAEACSQIADPFWKTTAQREIVWIALRLNDEATATRMLSTPDGKPVITPAKWHVHRATGYLERNQIEAFDRELAAAMAEIKADSRKKPGDSSSAMQGRVLSLLIKAGQLGKAEAWAKSNSLTSAGSLNELAAAQWKAGRLRQYRTSIARQLAWHLEQDNTRHRNQHFVLNSIKWIARIQHQVGDRPGLISTAARTEEFVRDIEGASPWIEAAVYGTLAMIQHWSGNQRGAANSLQRATAAAEIQTANPGKDPSIITTVWLSVSDSALEIGEIEAAIQAARNINKQESKGRQLVKVLARAGQIDAVMAAIEKHRTAHGKADLALWAAVSLLLAE